MTLYLAALTNAPDDTSQELHVNLMCLSPFACSSQFPYQGLLGVNSNINPHPSLWSYDTGLLLNSHHQTRPDAGLKGLTEGSLGNMKQNDNGKI